MASKPLPTPRSVPRGRVARLARFGSLTARVAGAAMVSGVGRLASGQRPKLSELVLTPANLVRLADQLAHLRGAAMKLGQLLSMDDGGLLPPALAELLARLRASAEPMPAGQLNRVLRDAWGPDWQRRFARFEVKPMAAASIGQVHRAILHDGRTLAIKIQYPGVAESIDSDVDNVLALLRLAGLLPQGWDLAPLVAEAKVQLKQEADYRAEARALTAYANALGERPDLCLPGLVPHLCAKRVLAMTYESGLELDALSRVGQGSRDEVGRKLFALLFEELFSLGWIQTDPNPANFRYRPDSGALVLLDFGACQPLAAERQQQYRALLRHGARGDLNAMAATLMAMGLLSRDATSAQRQALLKLVYTACEPLRHPGPYDFRRSDLTRRLQEQGERLGLGLKYRHLPPPALAFIHRKLGGCYLMAANLGARVDIHALWQPYDG